MRIALFFTYGVSLETWASVGNLARELAVYRKLIEIGHEVVFVTYGNRNDLDYLDDLYGIEIACNQFNLPLGLYSKLLPVLHRKALAKCHVFKTNQTNGGNVASRCAKHFRKRFIARCGYMLSEFEGWQHGPRARLRAEKVEADLFASANHIVVTTKEMLQSVVCRIPEAESKVSVIPNYVETDRFRPTASKKLTDVVFVGRLSSQKNLPSLLKAVRKGGFSLSIAGTGELNDALRHEFEDIDSLVNWMGNVPQQDLPSFLRSGRVFVLPSLYEGHPKALIEAMATGCSIVATNVPGIREVIRHNETGWLCETDAESIHNGIKKLLADEELRSRLGNAATERATQEFSLDNVAKLECKLLERIVNRNA